MIQDLIKKNRSYRRFDANVPLPKKVLTDWVDLARLSGSGANKQSLKYYISNEKAENEKIFQTLKWAGYLQDWDGPKESERPAAYIVILQDKAISENCFWDHGLAAQSILLGAVEAGFGGCMFASMDKVALKEILHLRDSLEILMVIALGKPVEKVVIEEMQNGDVKYFRDAQGIHHVPKRALSEILLP